VAKSRPELGERALAAALLGATALSIVTVHRLHAGSLSSVGGWLESATFGAVLLGILAAHELGHHAVARAHGLRLSLPLFLPAPFLFGTLGAILAVRDRPRSRGALLEMGAAGPVAGFCAIVLAISLRMLVGGGDPLEDPLGEPLSRPLVWWALGAALGGPVPELTTADPVGYAAWVGCLVTAMNLLPFGQLDGGHVLVALAPQRARAVGYAVSAALLALGALWLGWWAWLAAIWALAARRPWEVRGEAPGPRARAAAAAVLAVFGLCFTPIPW
jgi:membrane-associated protease RseP (regulator of RpoE activity)